MDFDFFELFSLSDQNDPSLNEDSSFIQSEILEQETFNQDVYESNNSEIDDLVEIGIISNGVEEQLLSDNIHETTQNETFDQSYLAESTNKSWFDDILAPFSRIIDDFYYIFAYDCDDVVTQNHFTSDGTMDLKNNVLVEGNVAHDIQFTEQQTHGSCSLMAQEQFVHRYTGQPIPEEYLEWEAQRWGVYSPDVGTIYKGQTMILEHFDIPHQRFPNMGIDDLNNAIAANKDIIIGVDAREFYDDASCPPGSGHAVAIVGRGLNPETHDVEGFYVTDSNFPKSAHFISIEKMQRAWDGDMITIPEKEIA